MSIASVASDLLSLASGGAPSPLQKKHSEFQKLGQDLQSGNLAAAQTDLAMLRPQAAGSGSPELQFNPRAHGHHHLDGDGDGSGGAGQLLSQMVADLQSGNLSAAQQAYGSLQQDMSLFGLSSPSSATSSLSLSA